MNISNLSRTMAQNQSENNKQQFSHLISDIQASKWIEKYRKQLSMNTAIVVLVNGLFPT